VSAGVTGDYAGAIGERLDRSPFCVMLDVDGTLAPIVATPERARVPDDTAEVVARLARTAGTTVVLVSGRAAADAWRVANIPHADVWVIGNHGFETREPSGRVTSDDRVRGFDATIGRAADALQDEFRGIEGAIVENKRWTLSLHYRVVHEAAVPMIRDRAAEIARELGLRILDGKKIVELRPPVDVNKGTACVAFATKLGVTGSRGSAFYAGDDRTDEDAFRELRAAVPEAVTVRVATDEEAAASSHAELVIRTLPEVRELLGWIVARRERGIRR
jgi:trehalose-phosphatase